MNNYFSKAFEKLDECMDQIGKGIEEVFESLNTPRKKTIINIKAGSKVYLGKGVYGIIRSDVEAEMVNGEEELKTKPEGKDPE